MYCSISAVRLSKQHICCFYIRFLLELVAFSRKNVYEKSKCYFFDYSTSTLLLSLEQVIRSLDDRPKHIVNTSSDTVMSLLLLCLPDNTLKKNKKKERKKKKVAPISLS